MIRSALQTAFPDPVKPPRFTTEPVGPLRCINKTAWGAKLLATACLVLAEWPDLWSKPTMAATECTARLPVYYWAVITNVEFQLFYALIHDQ